MYQDVHPRGDLGDTHSCLSQHHDNQTVLVSISSMADHYELAVEADFRDPYAP